MAMNTAPRLELRQGQSLVMTQQLQQSIKLLQMNTQEVQAFIDQQLEENPFLQDEERPEDQAPEAETRDNEAEEASEKEQEGTVEEAFVQDDWRAEDGFSDGSSLRVAVTPRDSDGDAMDLQDTRARDITLREHLMEQLQVEVSDPVLRRIGMHLIDLTDESGYIRENWPALAEQLGTDETHIGQALAALQTFDPSGVCARSVQECLSIQLRDLDRLDPAMEALLENLPLLADGNMEALKRKCGVDMEDLRQMVSEIRALNPKPGISFNHEVAQPVIPDVTVRRDVAGKWHVELNAAALPRVLVNKRYYAKVSVGCKGEDRKFMTDKIHEASWLVKALDQRANTILKVSTSILVQQEGFFRMGIHHLKPLTLKDIARETGFHESTISRVTSGKYLISPRGIYELKYFFTSGLAHKMGGDDVSSQTVKHLIGEMIGKEGGKVLSDDDIADLLKAKNIDVARRTVAKYREALSIPSSMQRRRQKQMHGG